MYNWVTTIDNKCEIMNQLRDSLSIDLIEVRSVQLAGELQTIVQDGMSIEAGSSTEKDDRVMGAALAHRAWVNWIRSPQIDAKETFARVMQDEEKRLSGEKENMVSFIVSDFFRAQEADRQQAEVDRAWES